MASLLNGAPELWWDFQKKHAEAILSQMHEGESYCAVLVRMDVRRACSSVRAEGTLGEIQSVPFGGLLTGFGWGISGFRSSGSCNRSIKIEMTKKFPGPIKLQHNNNT